MKEKLKTIFRIVFILAGLCPSASSQSWPSFIPKHYAVLDTVFGDLNLDPYPDVVLILKSNMEPDSPGMARPLLLLMGNAHGTYELKGRNDSIVLCKACGGVFGDPYEEAWIEHGTFAVFHYGGSAWRWTQEITFTYRQETKNFVLQQDVGESFHTSNPNRVKKIKHHKETWGKISFEAYRNE